MVMRPKRGTLVLGVEVHALQLLHTLLIYCNDIGSSQPLDAHTSTANKSQIVWQPLIFEVEFQRYRARCRPILLDQTLVSNILNACFVVRNSETKRPQIIVFGGRSARN